jgi:hypothetical protein
MIEVSPSAKAVEVRTRLTLFTIAEAQLILAV